MSGKSRPALRRRLGVVAVAAASLLTLTGLLGQAPATAATSAATVRTAAASGPLKPVPSVDLNRYVGRWNQVAAIPAIFNLQCARNSGADYALVDSDTISVVNSCRTWFGTTSTVTGKADVLDPATNAQLRVSFDGVPSFGDTTAPNYVVAYLAPDYSWAVVGDPDRNSGFVLSRTPRVPVSNKVLKRTIESLGYNSCRFLNTPVDGGRQGYLPLCLA